MSGMTALPPRYCEICGAIHEPPIHDLASCYPGKHGGRVYFSPLEEWVVLSDEEMQAALAYWDVVLADKGDKPLS